MSVYILSTLFICVSYIIVVHVLCRTTIETRTLLLIVLSFLNKRLSYYNYNDYNTAEV